MLQLLLGGDAGPPIPAATTPTVANIHNGAICTGASCTTKSGANDTIRVSWTMPGADNFYFRTKVYRDGALQATLNNTVLLWDDTAPGADNWAAGPVPVSYVYRVDVEQINDGLVVATRTAATFNRTYFTTCPGPC